MLDRHSESCSRRRASRRREECNLQASPALSIYEKLYKIMTGVQEVRRRSAIGVSALHERCKGDLGGWKADATWANGQAVQSMVKHDCKEEIAGEEVVQLVLRLLSDTMFSRTILASEKLELTEIAFSGDMLGEIALCATAKAINHRSKKRIEDNGRLIFDLGTSARKVLHGLHCSSKR